MALHTVRTRRGVVPLPEMGLELICIQLPHFLGFRDDLQSAVASGLLTTLVIRCVVQPYI